MASFLRCEGGHLAVLHEANADGSVEWTPPAARESPAAAMIAAAAAATATVAPSARRLAVETRDAAPAPATFSATESLLARDGGHLAVLYEAEIEGSMSALPIIDVHESTPPAAARERPAAAEAASAAKPTPGANVGAREFTPSPETVQEAKAKLRAAAAAAFDAARAPATEVRGVRASARDLEALAHQGLRAVASKLALTPATVEQLAKLSASNQRRAAKRLADRDVMSGVTDPNSFIVTDIKKDPTKRKLMCADRLLAGLLGKPPARPEPAPASEPHLEALKPALRDVAGELALTSEVVEKFAKFSESNQRRVAQRLADRSWMPDVADLNQFILKDLKKDFSESILLCNAKRFAEAQGKTPVRQEPAPAASALHLEALTPGLRDVAFTADVVKALKKFDDRNQRRIAQRLADPRAMFGVADRNAFILSDLDKGAKKSRLLCNTRYFADAAVDADLVAALDGVRLSEACYDMLRNLSAAQQARCALGLKTVDLATIGDPSAYILHSQVLRQFMAAPAPPAAEKRAAAPPPARARRGAPTAGDEEALGRTVFLSNLPKRPPPGEAELRSWMAGCGAIASVEIGRGRRSGNAYVVFEALAGAEAACDTLHGEDFPGSKRWSKRWITVTKARPPVAKAERPPVDGPEQRLLEMERRLGERERRLSDESDALARRRLEVGRADAGAALADEVLELVDESPSGTILCANLPQVYKEKFGEILDLRSRGGAKAVLSRLPGVRFEEGDSCRISREPARAPAAAARERAPAPAPASDAKLRALAADVLALCDAAPSGALLCGDLPRLYGRAFGRPLDLGGMKMFALMSRLPGVQLARTPAGTEVSRPCLPAGAAVSRAAAVAPPPRASPSKAEVKRRVARFVNAEGLDDGCRAALEGYAAADADRCARFLRAAPSNLGDARDRAAFVLDAVERRTSLAASARELAALAPELRDVADELALTSEVVATLAGLAPEDQTLVALALQSADLSRVKNLTGFVLMGLKKGTLLRKGQKQEAVRRSNGAPEEFLCPLTLELMRDPVIAADGHTYERAAIAAWLARKSTSPVTNERIVSHEVVPAHTIRSMIARFADGA